MHFAPWFVAKTHVTFLVSEKQNEDNRVVFPRFSRDWSRLYAIAWFSWKSLYFCWLRTLFEQRGRISVFGVGSLIGGMFEAFAQRFLQHGAKKVRKELLWTLWNWCFVRLLTESGTKRALLSCCAIWDSTCFQVAWEARKVRNNVHENRGRWSDERDHRTPARARLRSFTALIQFLFPRPVLAPKAQTFLFLTTDNFSKLFSRKLASSCSSPESSHNSTLFVFQGFNIMEDLIMTMGGRNSEA